MKCREILLVFSFALSAQVAHADGFENVAPGSRTAAMGGAGIAGGSDSAMPTLNPAGLALIPGPIASVSASLYQYSIVRIPHFIADGVELPTDFGPVDPSQQGVVSREFATFPSSVAYFLHLGSDVDPMTLGISLSVPRSISRRFVENTEFAGEGLSFQQATTHVISEQTYLGALSWAGAFGSLRVGASLLGGFTQALQAIDVTELQVRGTAGFHRSGNRKSVKEHSFDMGILAGAQYDITDELRFGLTFRTPSVHLIGKVAQSTDKTELDSGNSTMIESVLANGDATRGLPMRIGGGVEYHATTWGLALDVNAFLPRSREFSSTLVETRSSIGNVGGIESGMTRTDIIATKPVINLALGFEVQVTDTNWLRTGLFTDFSAFESAENALRKGDARQPSLFDFPINRYGGSVGWGSKFGPVDTTLGLRVSYGSGQTVRLNPDARFRYSDQSLPLGDVTDASLFEAVAFLSAAVDLSDSASGLVEHMGQGSSVTP